MSNTDSQGLAVDALLEIVEILVAYHGVDTQDALVWAQANAGRVAAQGAITPEAVARAVESTAPSQPLGQIGRGSQPQGLRGAAPDLSGGNPPAGQGLNFFGRAFDGMTSDLFQVGQGRDAYSTSVGPAEEDVPSVLDDVEVGAYTELLLQTLTADPTGDVDLLTNPLAALEFSQVDEEIARKWVEENSQSILMWVTGDVPLNQAVGMVKQALRSQGVEAAAAHYESAGTDTESQTEVRRILAQYGLTPLDARVLATDAATEINTLQAVYSNPDINALAMSYNFADAESWMNYIRDEFATSSSPELRKVSEASVTALWSFVESGALGNIGDQDEALRIEQRIRPFAPQGHAFTYDGGNGFVFAEDWAKVSNSLGLDPNSVSARRMTEAIFSQTAAIAGEDTAELAPYVALLVRNRGLVEKYETAPADPARSIFAAAFALREGTHVPGQSKDSLFEGGASMLAGQFQSALERFGRPELALIAVDNPMLAEKVYNYGSPQTEEERHEIFKILEQYSLEDLESIGFGVGFSARYVSELTTVGGSAGAALRASGATTVQQQDPEALAESYRQTYKAMLLEDPDESQVQAFVASIQGANRAAVAGATQEIISGFNVWQGTSIGSDEIGAIIERYDVNPAARQLAEIKGTGQYQALYRHLPSGVSEEEFVNRYRSKVGSVIGMDDIADNLGAVKFGMHSGDANAAQRFAYGAGATQDETVRSDIAAKVRYIRGLV